MIDFSIFRRVMLDCAVTCASLAKGNGNEVEEGLWEQNQCMLASSSRRREWKPK